MSFLMRIFSAFYRVSRNVWAVLCAESHNRVGPRASCPEVQSGRCQHPQPPPVPQGTQCVRQFAKVAVTATCPQTVPWHCCCFEAWATLRVLRPVTAVSARVGHLLVFAVCVPRALPGSTPLPEVRGPVETRFGEAPGTFTARFPPRAFPSRLVRILSRVRIPAFVKYLFCKCLVPAFHRV